VAPSEVYIILFRKCQEGVIMGYAQIGTEFRERSQTKVKLDFWSDLA